MLLENYSVKAINCFPKGGLTGRRKIKTAVKEINANNVVDVVNQALAIHSQNAAEIEYLYRYYCGCQDILRKKKYVRENINNKVIINRANEIVTFKTAYLLNEPIQYTSNNGTEETLKKINTLNEYMNAEDKESKDKEIADWMHICGVGERLVLDDKSFGTTENAPFCIFTLDPRNAFAIYNSGIGETQIAGVILQVDENNKTFVDVYTTDKHFIIKGDKVEEYPTMYGGIPLIEYVNNEARIGAFEVVISILNNINILESNAIDSVEDFVNGFDVFQNCTLEDDDYSNLSVGGKALKIKTVTQGMEAKVYRVFSELNQSGVQTRIDDLTDAYLTICGMPNRNGGTSTSDTGTAVIFRDGFFEAESRAKDTEKLFVRSEREMLKIVLHICDIANSGAYSLNLKLSDIKTEFLRKTLSNSQSKVQMLCEMLNNDKIHPLVAYQTAAIAKDNLLAYKMGMEWYKENNERELEELSKVPESVRKAEEQSERQDDEQEI